MPGAIDHLILAGLTLANLIGLSYLMAYVKRTKERADERVRFLALRVDVLTERADVQSSRADNLSDQVDRLIGGTGHPYRSRVFVSAPRRPVTKERREATERAVANLDLGNTLSHDEMFGDRDIKPSTRPGDE